MAHKRPPEQIAGRYSAIPDSVLDSVAFTGASHRAKALLFELMRQVNGSNNGHLQLATQWLNNRGWLSADIIQKAKLELVTRQLIVKTRLGGLNAGPDRWAVTWLIISNGVGLDLRPGQHVSGAWHLFVEPEKQKKRSVTRNSAVPSIGIVPPSAVPSHGMKTALLTASAIPPHGNNVLTNVRSKNGRKRIVGKPGKSGRKQTAQTLAPTIADNATATPPSASALNLIAAESHVDHQADDNGGDYIRERDTDNASSDWDNVRGEFVKPPAKVSKKCQVVEAVCQELARTGRIKSPNLSAI